MYNIIKLIKFLCSVYGEELIELTNDGAFENCSGLNSITFTSTTPSVFVGSDIINGCHEDLQIFISAGSLDNYKTYVFVDDTIASKFVEAQISA